MEPVLHHRRIKSHRRTERDTRPGTFFCDGIQLRSHIRMRDFCNMPHGGGKIELADNNSADSLYLDDFIEIMTVPFDVSP